MYSQIVKKKNLCSQPASACVCPVSCRPALEPATTAALLSALSPALVSSSHAITLSNETGVNACCKHTVPGSITSLSLSPVHFSLYPDWPVHCVAAGWMSVEGWREIGRQSYCHTVIGAKTWLMS